MNCRLAFLRLGSVKASGGRAMLPRLPSGVRSDMASSLGAAWGRQYQCWRPFLHHCQSTQRNQRMRHIDGDYPGAISVWATQNVIIRGKRLHGPHRGQLPRRNLRRSPDPDPNPNHLNHRLTISVQYCTYRFISTYRFVSTELKFDAPTMLSPIL